jgi:hypothetical protein
MAINWLVIGLTLGGEIVFACAVAVLTRTFSKHLHGQVYALVVLGVGGVVILAGPLIGWMNVLILGGCFAAAGLVMGVEYYTRLLGEVKQARSAAEKMLAPK